MKETVNVNIGSQVFILEQDARTTLESYLDDIRSRLPEHDTETMSDIESRIAELFREKAPSAMLVITLDMVRAAMQQMGSPAEFGEPCEGTNPAPAEVYLKHRKLYRSRTNCRVAGICAGIAEFFDADPTLIRLITLLLIFFGGLSIWVYIILWIVIPEAPAVFKPKFNKKQ